MFLNHYATKADKNGILYIRGGCGGCIKEITSRITRGESGQTMWHAYIIRISTAVATVACSVDCRRYTLCTHVIHYIYIYNIVYSNVYSSLFNKHQCCIIIIIIRPCVVRRTRAAVYSV